MSSKSDKMSMDDIKTESCDSASLPGISDHDFRFCSDSTFRSTTIDYWYGKKCFEELVAKVLFSEYPQNQPSSHIDSQFHRLIRDFPYIEAIHGLQTARLRVCSANCLSADTDAYQTLVSLMGTNLRLGTTEEQDTLLCTVKQFIGGMSRTRTRLPLRQQFSPPAAPLLSQNRDPSHGDNQGMKIGYYTSMIKEKADSLGLPLEYRNIERSSSDPESFRAELLFHGRSFVGLGKSGKQAKHQASLEACKYLESQRENML